MKLLAIETSTEACSVALWVDGGVIERHALAPRRHAELVLPWTDALLAEAGIAKSSLDAIAVGRGPGAFTGVRLAVAIVQGMAMALDRPVLPVSTLAALALPEMAGVAAGAQVLAAIDARMGELYLGLFAAAPEAPVAIGEEWMARPESAEVEGQAPLLGVGSGFAAGEGALVARLGSRLLRSEPSARPHAADVARLGVAAFERGDAIAPDRLEPAYLRDKVALTIHEQKASRAR